RRFAAGQLIIGPEPGHERIYVTRSGTVRLLQRHANGREVMLERLERGHLFGVTGLLSSSRNHSVLLAQAETDVEVCIVDERRFLDIVARWPSALLELATCLGVRVHHTEDGLPHVTSTGAQARLARVL